MGKKWNVLKLMGQHRKSKAFDEAFIESLRNVISSQLESIEALDPNSFDLQEKAQTSATIKKEAMKSFFNDLDRLLDKLEKKSAQGLLWFGIKSAVTYETKLKGLLTPFVTTISKLHDDGQMTPEQRAELETNTTQSLVNLIKFLPKSNPNKVQLN